MTRWLVVLSFAVLGTGCLDVDSDDGGSAPGPDTSEGPATCPTVQPTDATACSPEGAMCEYLIEACACGPSDISWHFTCADGAWTSSRDYDCYPCP